MRFKIVYTMLVMASLVMLVWLSHIQAPPNFVFVTLVLLGWPIIGIAYYLGRQDARRDARHNN